MDRCPDSTPDSRNLADEKVGGEMSAYVDARIAKEAYERGEITADEFADIERDADYEARAEAWEYKQEDY